MDVYQACIEGNLSWLIKNNKQLADLNTPSNHGWTGIELAAENGHLDVVKWLVSESGQPVDVTVSDDFAIRYAAEYGYLDIIKWLVMESTTAHKEASQKFGFEFLYRQVDATACDSIAIGWAAENGHLDVVKWLVKDYFNASKEVAQSFGVEFLGSPVDVTNRGNSAVIWSAANGHLDVVKWLVLESGQPVDVTMYDTQAIKEATKNGHNEVSEFLNNITKLHKAGITIEQIQARPGSVKLVEKGVDPAVIISLSDSDIDDLLAQSSTAKNRQSKLRM